MADKKRANKKSGKESKAKVEFVILKRKDALALIRAAIAQNSNNGNEWRELLKRFKALKAGKPSS